jgi:hypothetical protein
MSSALLDAPGVALRPAGAGAGTDAAGGHRPTLSELLTETLRTARAQSEADCPLCHGPMHAADGAARCESCGTTLS